MQFPDREFREPYSASAVWLTSRTGAALDAGINGYAAVGASIARVNEVDRVFHRAAQRSGRSGFKAVGAARDRVGKVVGRASA